MKNDVKESQITIIGLGLIGGSLAKTLKKINSNQKIFGWDKNKKIKSQSKKYLKFSESIEKAVSNSKYIILCTPPAIIPELLTRIEPLKSLGSVVMDVSSVKKPIIDGFKKHPGWSGYFIPTHPMAGSERSGFEASHENLFLGKTALIMPIDKNNKVLVDSAVDFWTEIGAKPEITTLEKHDKEVAVTSHIPHILIYVLVTTFKEYLNQDDV